MHLEEQPCNRHTIDQQQDLDVHPLANQIMSHRRHTPAQQARSLDDLLNPWQAAHISRSALSIPKPLPLEPKTRRVLPSGISGICFKSKCSSRDRTRSRCSWKPGDGNSLGTNSFTWKSKAREGVPPHGIGKKSSLPPEQQEFQTVNKIRESRSFVPNAGKQGRRSILFLLGPLTWIKYASNQTSILIRSQQLHCYH